MAKRPLDYNWAQDEDFAKELTTNLLEIWRQCKSDRIEREDVWQESYRAWSVSRDNADKNYEGRADLFLPQLRKEVETMSRRITKGLFPDDYLKAEPSRFENEDVTITNTQVVRHYLDNVMDFSIAAEPWVKQGVLFGTSPIRTFWHKKTNEQFFRERYFVSNKEGVLEPKFRVAQKEVTLYNAPVARAESIFNTWVYPTNISHIRDAKIIFWRTKITRKDLETKAKEGTAHGIDDLKDMAKTADLEFEEKREMMQQFGESGELLAIQDDGFYDLLECWLEIELPDGTKCAPVVTEIINEQKATRIQRNGFWHQQAPFDFLRFIKPPPGEYYGRGLPEASIALQHQLNDILNQGMDSATLALNNITIINPAFAPNAESFEIEPGAQWWADPNGVKQFQFPDLTDTSIKNAGMLRQFITEMSDNSPQLPDPIAGKARSTGQAQLAVNEWQTDLFSFLASITGEGLNPMAQKIHSLLQQNLSDDEVIRVSGKYAGTWINRVVTPEDIVGKFDFKWVGALQIENQSVKTQQMLNFLKVYGAVPPDARVKINWENFMIKLLRDGFLIKDIHNIIETDKMTASTTPNIEGRILKQGGMVQVVKSDDDAIHIEQHTKDLNSLPKTDLYLRALFAKHIYEHEEQAKKKQMEIQAVQNQMAAMQMAQQGMDKGQGGQGGPKQQTAGNVSQMQEATDPADIMKGMRA